MPDELTTTGHELALPPKADPFELDSVALIGRLVTVLQSIATMDDAPDGTPPSPYEMREMARAALGIDLASQGMSDPTMRNGFFKKWGILPPPALTDRQTKMIQDNEK